MPNNKYKGVGKLKELFMKSLAVAPGKLKNQSGRIEELLGRLPGEKPASSAPASGNVRGADRLKDMGTAVVLAKRDQKRRRRRRGSVLFNGDYTA